MKQAVFETYESEVRSYCRKFPAIFKTAKMCIRDRAVTGHGLLHTGVGANPLLVEHAQMAQGVGVCGIPLDRLPNIVQRSALILLHALSVGCLLYTSRCV